MRRSARLLTFALLALAPPSAALAASSGSGSQNDPVVAVTDDASAVTSTSVRFNAHLFVRNVTAKYRFRYDVDDGTSLSHLTQTRSTGVQGSSMIVFPTETIADLRPGTTYVVQIEAWSTTSGTDTTVRVGNVKRFTTPGSASSGGSGSSGSGTSGSGSSRPVTIVPSPPTVPLPTQPVTDAPTSSPQLGQSAGAATGTGTVTVKQPGTNRFVTLGAGDTLPMGSVIDTRRGTVALTTALPSGRRQTGRFRGGLFSIGQGRDGYVDLTLRGPVCARPRPRTASAAFVRAAGKRRGGRRLYGRDHGGRFRTHGRHSQATVRGTRWMVEDRCDGTLTTVSQGAVVVRDFKAKRRVLVRAGGRYLAHARG